MTTEEVLEHHLACVRAGDVDGVMADYTEASVLLTPDGPLHGLAEIRSLFESFLVHILPPSSDFSMDHLAVEGEIAFCIWHACSPGFDFPLGTDTFVVRKGKIAYQTFAAQIDPR